MMSDALSNTLLENLKSYKRKFYLNALLKGLIFFLTLLTSTYLFFTLLEYYGKFNTPVRVIFFFTYIIAGSLAMFSWIIQPALKLFAINRQLSDEEASRQIGEYFPNISDKLLNTLQLRNLNREENELISASIIQKTRELSVIPFVQAIDYKENRKYLRYLVTPLFFILLILLFIPQIFIESTARIINYDKTFLQPAPFRFILENKSLSAFKNEDFDISLSIEGEFMPESVYLINKGKKSKMRKDNQKNFSFNFKNLQQSESFYFEAAGFNSRDFEIDLISRPDLKYFDAFLNYPKYLNKKNERLKNAGNLTVPEGTEITWEFKTIDAEKMHLRFSNKEPQVLQSSGDNFTFSHKSMKSENYELQLENKRTLGKEVISYSIQVIPDQFPMISAEQFKDTILFSYISLGGNISDDYGLSRLKLFYKVINTEDPKKPSEYQGINISIDPKYLSQNFLYTWALDSLNLKPGQRLEYFLQVWDNDGVNGHKSSRSKVFEFKIPSKNELEKELSEASRQAENKIDNVLSKTMQLQREINRLQEKIKTKNTLNWQDKKSLEEILKKHEELKKELGEINKFNDQLNQKNELFKEQSPELAYKMEQLQKLMDDLLDDETKKLYEELQKLMNETMNKNDIQKVLEEIKKKDFNLEKELERALEMFKQIKFDLKLEQIVKDLKEAAKEQEKLAEKTLNKEESPEKLAEEQEKLNKEFEKIKEDLKELKDINESLDNKKDLGDTGAQEQEISKDQQQSSEQLKNNQPKKAGSSQKSAAQKMEKLSDKLSQMQMDMNMQQAQEDIDDLRDILENLIKLSFDQENLMKEFRKVNQSDPRFVSLSQTQLKLKDDSKIIEDSLMALAKRVFQIESFVTRELGQMKDYMDESVRALKDRRADIASGKQQFAMTSMNNLALMLSDVLKQMQEQMNQAMNSSGSSSCKKPGKNQQPGLGDLQKQLNEQIQQLKQSGKTGRELSEELARLAAQQEMIRRALKEMEKGMDKNRQGGTPLNKLGEKMEETELDLVNKQITQETLMRQKEILTRLLEAEKAMRERELDEKREAESAREIKREVPPSFEKYLKAKEKQIDLLKTVSPSLTPYFKQEVNEYFQKIEK